MKFKSLITIGVIIVMFLCGGCSTYIEDADFEMYSRNEVIYSVESALFGRGRNDDVYTALAFVYEDESIREKHGSDFDIKATDITCHFSEGETYFFLGLYNGSAEYSFVIEEEKYRVKLSKGIFGVWRVTECFAE